MEKIAPPIVEERLLDFAGWKMTENKWLIKKYRFQSYLAGIAFVNQIAELSERENHHPFISIDYIVITLKLSSWKANGITELDFKLIEQYDRMYTIK